MEGEQEGLGNSLRVTIERSELTDALIEAGDLSLERIADVADGIPVLKWITSAGRTALTIRDYLFVRKLAAFLTELKALPPGDRANLIQRLDQEPAYANRAAEALITVLDRVDSTLKARWLAKALRAYATEQITARELMRLNAVVERVLVCDVEGIVAMLEKQEMERQADDDSAQSALLAGLAATTHGYGGGGLVSTPVYRLFKKHVLENT
jgi:hypothetical protein